MASTTLQYTAAVKISATERSTLAEHLRTAADLLETDSEAQPKVLASLNSITDNLRGAQDVVFNGMFAASQATAIRLFRKWGVFEIIPSDATISYSDIAKRIGADVNLVTRMAWILVSAGILKQVGGDQVTHTHKSIPFATLNPLSALATLMFDSNFLAMQSMPRYFDTYGLKEPIGHLHTVVAYAMGHPDKTMWDLVAQDKEVQALHMLAMSIMVQEWPALGTYDLSWAVARGAEDASRAVVVDVGGGRGHCLKEMVTCTPGLSIDRCVLEDRENVLEMVKQGNDPELQGLQMVPVDFHTEQPVKGALVYYIRRCLHDYGDKDAADILRQISGAMAPDSRLLIAEHVLSNPPSVMSTFMDLAMATIGGKERTLENFTNLVGEAGLKIKQVFGDDPEKPSVLECVKL